MAEVDGKGMIAQTDVIFLVRTALFSTWTTISRFVVRRVVTLMVVERCSLGEKEKEKEERTNKTEETQQHQQPRRGCWGMMKYLKQRAGYGGMVKGLKISFCFSVLVWVQNQLLFLAIRGLLLHYQGTLLEVLLRLLLPVAVCFVSAPLRNLRSTILTNLTVGVVAEEGEGLQSMGEVWAALLHSMPWKSWLWRGWRVDLLDRYVGLLGGLGLPMVLRYILEDQGEWGLPRPLRLVLSTVTLSTVSTVLHHPYLVITERLALLRAAAPSEENNEESGEKKVEVEWQYRTEEECIKAILSTEGVKGFFTGSLFLTAFHCSLSLPVVPKKGRRTELQ